MLRPLTRRLLASLAVATAASCSNPSGGQMAYSPPNLPMCDTTVGGSHPIAFGLPNALHGLEILPGVDPARLPPGSTWSVRAELESSGGFALLFEPASVCGESWCRSWSLPELDTLPTGATFEGGAVLVERVGERLELEVGDASPPGRYYAVHNGTTPIQLRGTLRGEVTPATPTPCSPLTAHPTLRPQSLPSVCGNGIVEHDETCDDANAHPGDGCGADCLVEAALCTDTGWAVADCTGAPSTCTMTDCTLDDTAPVCLDTRGQLLVTPTLDAPGRLTADQMAAARITLGDGRTTCVAPATVQRRSTACDVAVRPCGRTSITGGDGTRILACDPDAGACEVELTPSPRPLEVGWSQVSSGVLADPSDVAVARVDAHPEGGMVASAFVRPALEYQLQRFVPAASGDGLELAWSLRTGDGHEGQPMATAVGPDGASYVVVTRNTTPDADGHRERLPAELWRVDPDGQRTWAIALTDRDLRGTVSIAVSASGEHLVVMILAPPLDLQPDARLDAFEWLSWRIDPVAGAVLGARIEPAGGRIDDLHVYDDGTVLRAMIQAPAEPDGDWLDVPGLTWALPAGSAHDVVSRIERVDLAAGTRLWARQWYEPFYRAPIEIAGVIDDGPVFLGWLRDASDENLSAGGAPYLVALDADGATRTSLPLSDGDGCEQTLLAGVVPSDASIVVAANRTCEGEPGRVLVERLDLDGTTRWIERLDATGAADASLQVHHVAIDRATGHVMLPGSRLAAGSGAWTGRLLVLAP